MGSGDLRFGEVEAGAVINNSHGDTSVGAVGGNVVVHRPELSRG